MFRFQSLFSTKIIEHYWRLFSFLIATLFCVLIDLLIFYALFSLANNLVIANYTASTASLTIRYFIVSRTTFSIKLNSIGLVLFACFYAFSVSLFTGLIYFIVHSAEITPLVVKILLMPISFFFNYFFTSLIFRWCNEK
jgi:hypothetical protein